MKLKILRNKVICLGEPHEGEEVEMVLRKKWWLCSKCYNKIPDSDVKKERYGNDNRN